MVDHVTNKYNIHLERHKGTAKYVWNINFTFETKIWMDKSAHFGDMPRDTSAPSMARDAGTPGRAARITW